MELLVRPYFALVLLCSGAAAQASEVKCPETYTKHGKSGQLNAAGVFEGKPAKQVDLMPELETWEWDITPNQRYVKQSGKHMFLVCRYKGLKETVALEIPADATFCKVEGTRTGTTAWCNASSVASEKQVMRD